MLKNRIRKKLLKLRQKKNLKNILFQPDKILNFLENINLKKKIIGCYYPINHEVNTIELIKKFQKKKISVGLPIINKNFDMNFYEYKLDDFLYINKLGVPEPKPKKKIIPNILIIPIVGFDINLYRIGYGGGYYDRFIKKMKKKKLIKIGLAFSYQKVKKVPINKHDKKMDYIFTEKELYK